MATSLQVIRIPGKAGEENIFLRCRFLGMMVNDECYLKIIY